MAGNWTTEDKNEILKAFTVLATIQKTYGKEIDIRATLQAWEYVLADQYSAGDVVEAMSLYMRQSSDIPTPANLISLMTSPEVPRISTAEFIHAKEQHALEGFPAYGYWGQIIKQYENENHDARLKPVAPIEQRKSLEKGSNWKRLT